MSPAISRRPGQSRRSTPASIVRDGNGQALAYVYCEEQPRKMLACRCRLC
jgi:hypothetical protein